MKTPSAVIHLQRGELPDALGADMTPTEPAAVAILDEITHELEQPAAPHRHRQVADQPEEESEQHQVENPELPRDEEQSTEAQSHTQVADDTRPVEVTLLALALRLFLIGLFTDLLGTLVVDRVLEFGRSHIPRPSGQDSQENEGQEGQQSANQLTPGNSRGCATRSIRARGADQVLESEPEHHERDATQGPEVSLTALLLFVDHRQQHRADDDEEDVPRVTSGPIENGVEHVFFLLRDLSGLNLASRLCLASRLSTLFA